MFKALSSEVKGKHGIGPALLIFDELAQFGADREFYDTLIQGRGAHEEPLLWIISTQAPDDKSVLSQEIDYGMKVMRGEIDDPTVLCFLFTTPEEADIMDQEAWKLSNPALDDFLSLADMMEAARTAKNMPSAEARFRNLRLNQRISAAAQFISPNVWKMNGDAPDMGTFEDAPVTGGLDLSAKNDLTSLTYVAESSPGVWDILPFFWTPKDNLKERSERDRVPYDLWVNQGHLAAVPGKTIDYRYVARAIAEHMGQMNIVGLKFDRWRIADFQRALVEEGVDAWIDGKDDAVPGGLRLIPHGQGFRDMNPAVEVLEDLLAECRMRHGNHPVMTMCAANVRVQSDPAGNRKFDKLKSTGRIDGIVSMAMALNGAVGGPSDDGEIKQGFLDID
jgi:phage terminase large subunit-like protein